MFNWLEWYEDAVEIYRQTVKGSKDEQTVETVFLEFECPKQEADELSAVVANWLAEKGYDPEDFYAG